MRRSTTTRSRELKTVGSEAKKGDVLCSLPRSILYGKAQFKLDDSVYLLIPTKDQMFIDYVITKP